MELFDSHNHLHLSGEPLPPPGTPACACSATCEAEWEIVRQYSKADPVIVPGFGIHPWKADTAKDGWEDRLEFLLRYSKGAFVGEAGLDGYRAARPRGLSMEIQRKVLLPQLEIAQRYQVPVVLHCVRAWEHLSRFLREAKVERFALHRFKGEAGQVSEAMRMGAYLSLHLDSVLHQPTLMALPRVPLQRILIESDYDGPRPDSLPLEEELKNVLAHLVPVFGKDMEFLAHLTAENARKFYHRAPLVHSGV